MSYPEYTFDCEMLVEMTQNSQYVKKEDYSRREIDNKVNQPFINVNFNSYGIVFSLLYSRLIAKSKGGINWYVNVNPGYSVDVIKFKGKEYNAENESQDTNGNSYLWKVALLNINEKDVFHGFDIPFGIGLTKSKKSVSLTVDFGFWLNYTFLQKHSSIIDTAKYSYYYADSNKIDTNEIFNKLSKKWKAPYKNTDFGIYAAIGVMFKLKNYWYLKTSVEYRYAFTNRKYPNYNPDLIKTFTKTEYQPFFNSINNWHTNRFHINIGIIRKF